MELPFRGAAVVGRGGDVARAGGGHYLIYSVTKTYLAVIVLRLAERGVVSLDDEVHGATVRQLLQNTSGIGDYGRLPEYDAAVAAAPGSPWSDDEILARVGHDFPPGEGWAYSNTGFLLVRRLIDEAAGLEHALQDEIVEPLGLRETRFALAPVGGSTYDPRWVGHRTLLSTAEEVFRFLSALLDGELLTPDSQRRLLDAVPIGHDEPGFGRPSYGLGVMVDPEWEGGTLVGHGGGGPGYRAGAFGVLGGPIAVVLTDEYEADAQGEALRLLAAAIRDGR